jgi:hypothetical protein
MARTARVARRMVKMGLGKSMNLQRAFALAAAAAVLGAAAAAHAGTPAMSYSNNTGESLGNPPFTLGWEFTVNTPVTVDGLGVFDDSLDGLAESHDVGLWNSTGTLLTSTTVLAGTADPLIGNFRYADIAPLTLQAGTYVIGATWLSGADNNVFTTDGGVVTTIPQITFDAAAYTGGSTLADPTSIVAASEGYFGPNLLVTPVPEPATWAMMLVGFGGMGAAMRGRRKSACAAA